MTEPDHVKGLVEALKGVRMNFKPSMRKILAVAGFLPIKKIDVVRRPLSSKFKKILNFLNNITDFKGTPHDKLYHLLLVVQIYDGRKYILEKNEDLNADAYIPSGVDETLNIPITDNTMTMNSLLNNAILKFGPERIYVYDAFSTNCQQFVMDVLEGSNINITPEIKKFILQDVSQLTSSWSKKLASKLTSLYNRLKMAIVGYGDLHLNKPSKMSNQEILTVLKIPY